MIQFINILKKKDGEVYCFSSVDDAKSTASKFGATNWTKGTTNILEAISNNLSFSINSFENNSYDLSIFCEYWDQVNDIAQQCEINGLFVYDTIERKYIPYQVLEKISITENEFKQRVIKCIEIASEYRKDVIVAGYQKRTKKFLWFKPKGDKDDLEEIKREYMELEQKNYRLNLLDTLKEFWDIYGLSKEFEKRYDHRFYDEDRGNCIYKWVGTLFKEKVPVKTIENDLINELAQTRQRLMASGGFQRVMTVPWISLFPEEVVKRYEVKFQSYKKAILDQRRSKQ